VGTSATFEAVIEAALTKIEADLGLTYEREPRLDDVSDMSLFTRRLVVKSLVESMIGRYVAGLGAYMARQDETAASNYDEADGIRYALIPFVGFETALALKDKAYDMANERLAAGA
jgi:hypothetical protein